MDQIETILEVSAATILLFSAGLIFREALSNKSKFYLCVFFLTFGMILVAGMTEDLIDGTLGEASSILVTLVAESAAFVLGPLLWLYTWHVCRSSGVAPTLRKSIWLSILVFAILLWAEVAAYGSTQEFIVTTFSGLFSLPAYELIPILIELFILPAQLLFYVVLVSKRLSQHRKFLRDNYADVAKRDLSWLRILSVALLVYWFVFTILEIQNSDISDMLLSVATLVIVVLFAHNGLTQSEMEQILDRQKYTSSPLTAQRCVEIADKAMVALQEDQLFLDADLTLQKLATHISVKPNYVSQAINTQIEQTFYEFVNAYRVKHCQTLLTSTDVAILDVAYASGFNTKSAFYNAFSKHSGQTPMKFRKDAAK